MPKRYIFVDSYGHGENVVPPASYIFAHEGDTLVSSQHRKVDQQYLTYLSSLRSAEGKRKIKKYIIQPI